MSGFDSYLYLYDSNFKPVSSNDDSNPPGFGGSQLKIGLTKTTAVASGTSITSGSSTSITTGSGTVINSPNYSTILFGDAGWVQTSGTTLTTGSTGATITTGSGSMITTGSATLVTGSGAVIVTGSTWMTTAVETVITTGSGAMVIVPGWVMFDGTTIYTTGSATITILTNANFHPGKGTVVTTGSSIVVTPLQYYVEATSYAKNVLGNYTLNTTKGGLTQVPNPWDPSGSGSVNGQPVPLAFATSGTLSTASFSHARSGCYANYYIVQATKSGQTTITVSGFDSYLYVYNSSGKLVAKNDDSTPPGGGGSRVALSLVSGNNYVIEVTSYFKAKTGSYTMTVSSPTSAGFVGPITNPF
jgi:hypothetical protein